MPGAAQAVADVDRDPQHVDGGAEVHDRARVAAVDRGGVARRRRCAAPPARRRCPAARSAPDQAEHRARASRARAAPRGRPGRRARAGSGCVPGTLMPASLGDPRGVLADQADVEAAAGEQRVAHLRGLLRVEQERALALSGGAAASRPPAPRRSAPSRWCTGSSCRSSCCPRSARPPWPGRRSRPRAPARCRGRRRSPGCPTVRGAHHGDAAGGDDDAGALVGHQRVDQRDRRLVHHLHDPVRRAGRDGGLGERPGRVGAALAGQRVRADDDGVAGSSARAAP